MGKEPTSNSLRIAKEQWIHNKWIHNKLIYKKVKLEECIEKRNRKQDNIKFHRDQAGFFKTLEGDQTREETLADVEKFVKIWCNVWEKTEITPNIPWMEEVKRYPGEKITVKNEFDWKAKKEIKERKSWKAPGIDGVQNFWWKKVRVAQKPMLSTFKRINYDKNIIPGWCSDKRQLGVVERLLGTVEQLIINRCIMEEIKQYRRNLAVAFYDYKKAYDKVRHDLMLSMYQWIGIPKEIMELIY